MLAGEGRRPLQEQLAAGQERARERLVHLGDAERRAQAGDVVDGRPGEAGAGVVRAEDDDDVVPASLGLPPRVGGELAREDVAGVRREQAERPLRVLRHGVVEEGGDRRAQLRGVVGIELAGHVRLAHGGGGGGRRQRSQCHQTPQPRHDHTPGIFCPHAAQAPSFIWMLSTKNPLRSMITAPQPGQKVRLPSSPGTLPTYTYRSPRPRASSRARCSVRDRRGRQVA